ncbi:MAG: DUF808 domain-containing protein [Sphingomicrobium sp.]
MAASSLLALIDDIAAILDDVSVMAKVAAKKTTGVLGDDLALNAQQVTGVHPDRELPVVWAVAKGSMLNKLILVPAALAISTFVPWLITPLLMLGGAFLCFEGFEKIAHRFWPHGGEEHEKPALALADPAVDMVALEKDKIKGAVRTDFILSAEIIAIALNELGELTLGAQAAALALVSIAITVGVYGVVGLIVKLDDIGLHMAARRDRGSQAFGRGLVHVVPSLLSGLSGIGTAAMLWVGGGILLHGLEVLGAPAIPHLVHDAAHQVHEMVGGGVMGAIMEWLANAVGAAIAGGIIGGIIAMIVRRLVKHPEELIVD